MDDPKGSTKASSNGLKRFSATDHMPHKSWGINDNVTAYSSKAKYEQTYSGFSH
jgi:hypothetical protein